MVLVADCNEDDEGEAFASMVARGNFPYRKLGMPE
jgi:hypothetical protein